MKIKNVKLKQYTTQRHVSQCLAEFYLQHTF